MIEPKDLELGKGERAVWLEELVKYRERGWFAFFFFLVAPGAGPGPGPCPGTGTGPLRCKVARRSVPAYGEAG